MRRMTKVAVVLGVLIAIACAPALDVQVALRMGPHVTHHINTATGKWDRNSWFKAAFPAWLIELGVRECGLGEIPPV